MRIIDADALKEKSYWECYSDPDDDYEYVLVTDIDREPTIDAVPVVRCKDCIYRFTSCPMIHWRQNGYIHFFTEDTDYCSKGRKYEN